MKKSIGLISLLIFVTALVSCSSEAATEETATDYPAAIMADDSIYLLSAEPMEEEIDEIAVIGYTEYYTDTFPERNGETNFNRELNMPFAKVEGGIAVLYENKWYLCTPNE